MGSQPAYTRIRNDLLGRIQNGELEPGDQLPSESALAEQYGVTRMTVRQAMHDLVRNGMVGRQQGRGSFVLPTRSHDRQLRRLTSFTEDMQAQDSHFSTEVLAQEDVVAPQEIAAELSLPPGAHATRLLRLRSVEGRPVALQESWIPYGRCPALAREPLLDGSLYKTLEQQYGIPLRRASTRITAVAASKERAELLHVPARSPLLYVERHTYDATNAPIEFVRSWTNPEYPFSVELER